MSNIPSLLRQQAEGLRKEAEDNCARAEEAFYAALVLVKEAESTNDDMHKAMMLDAAQRQAAAMERHGITSSVDSRISSLTPEDIAELKAKIAAIEGHQAAMGAAYSAAPVSNWKRPLLGAMLGMPLGPPGMIIGGVAGALSAAGAKQTYAENNHHQGAPYELGVNYRDSLLEKMDKSDVARKVHEYAEDAPVPSYGVEDYYDTNPAIKVFYKKASVGAIQDLYSSGQIDAEVAQAALDELELRMS